MGQLPDLSFQAFGQFQFKRGDFNGPTIQLRRSRNVEENVRGLGVGVLEDKAAFEFST
jgi:hypothetical protein